MFLFCFYVNFKNRGVGDTNLSLVSCGENQVGVIEKDSWIRRLKLKKLTPDKKGIPLRDWESSHAEVI